MNEKGRPDTSFIRLSREAGARETCVAVRNQSAFAEKTGARAGEKMASMRWIFLHQPQKHVHQFLKRSMDS
jgi:hypothetical protein